MSKYPEDKDGSLSCSGTVKDPSNALLLINKNINLVLPKVPALCNHTLIDRRHQIQAGDGMRRQHKTN